MSDFEVDLQAMSSLVSSLSSFEEAAKEDDVEDWVPNSGMLDNPDVWSVTNSFQDTWEKGQRFAFGYFGRQQRPGWGVGRVWGVYGKVQRTHADSRPGCL